MNTMEYAHALEKHYAANWSSPIASIRWGKGPIDELPEEFRVLVFERSPHMRAYATECMSQPTDERRLEVHMFTRQTADYEASIVEILTAVAHYHRTGATLWLGHSINFGRPWIPGSACTQGLISLPYLDGPNLEYVAGLETRLLWLIPVTAAEVKYKKRHGMDALEERFEAAQFDFLDPLRLSVV